MTSCEIFEEMYNLQADLNKFIGRDTLNCDSSSKKLLWTYDLLIALHDETTELYNCFRWKWWDTKVKNDESRRFEIYNLENAKIELIDILHFFISLCHLWSENEDFEIISGLLFNNYRDKSIVLSNSLKFMSVVSCILKISEFLEKISAQIIQQNESYFSSQDIQLYILQLACNIGVIIDILNMSPEEILNIYKKKHKINFERQLSNYAMDTKSEDDNKELAKNLN